jgi:hypothetical protein
LTPLEQRGCGGWRVWDGGGAGFPTAGEQQGQRTRLAREMERGPEGSRGAEGINRDNINGSLAKRLETKGEEAVPHVGTHFLPC